MEDNDKNEIRDSLKDMLNNGDDSSNLPIETSDNADLPARIAHEPLNYLQVKNSSEKKGKKLMNSLLKLYLSNDVIEKNEYIQLKAQIDEMTLSSLIYQMKTAEHALTTLLQTIDSGELHPRMFEVLGGLQKTMLDIMKHQTLHLHAMEEGMKKLKHDIDIYTIDTQDIDENTKISKPSDDNITRGTRHLMMEIQDELSDSDDDNDDDDE